MKTVRVRLNRPLDPIDGGPRATGYETTMSAALAESWARNGRITILTNAKAGGRAKEGAADPTQAPQPGSPAGSGAQSSSPRRGRPPRKPTSD